MCQVTANHGGHFTFRVCPVSREGDPSQDCLDTNLLTVLNTVSSTARNEGYPKVREDFTITEKAPTRAVSYSRPSPL